MKGRVGVGSQKEHYFMTEQIFNKPRYKQRRQDLRNNATAPEQKLWAVLRGKQMGVKFRRQHGIGHYIVDFYCPERKLVIELDGESHFTDDAQVYDQERDTYLQGLGLRVLRFTNAQVVENLEGVYETIRQVI
jgi:very-short-patch-repair endonuclease